MLQVNLLGFILMLPFRLLGAVCSVAWALNCLVVRLVLLPIRLAVWLTAAGGVLAAADGGS